MLWNAMGFIGAAAIILAYALLQFGYWQSQQRVYSATNAFGAALILLSLIFEPNWPSVVIESFWLLISLIALLSKRSPQKQSPQKIDA